MSVLAEIHSNHRRFHVEIARRAALVPQKVDQSYSIPNTPFGVKKIHPNSSKLREPMWNRDSDWWHCMWFFDLVSDRPFGPQRPSVRSIQLAVCADFGVRLIDMLSERRTKAIVMPRQVAMFLSKRLTTRTLPEIGRRFGGRDHTTALHAIAKIAAAAEADPRLKARLSTIAASLGGSL